MDNERHKERIYQEDDGQWFYSRRGDHAGPFITHDAADRALRKYLRSRSRKIDSDLFGSGFDLVKSLFRKIAA